MRIFRCTNIEHYAITAENDSIRLDCKTPQMSSIPGLFIYLILDKLYCLVGVHGKVSPLHHLAKVTVLVVVTKLILILVVRAEDHGGINQKWLVIYLI